MKKIPEADIQKILGDYHAPKGLYSATKDMPFLGKVSCNVESIVAGSWQEIVIDYELGASGMADGSWFKATFRFYSDWALFQTTEPTAANYVSAEYHAAPTIPGQSPATVQKLTVRFDQKGHERPFQKAIIVDTFDGYLKAGDHIVIRLGDRRFGGAGTRVQTFVEQNFKIRCYVDPLGTSRFAAINPDLVIQIVPGAPAQLMWAGSRIVRAGEKLPLRLRAEDEWGNACWDRPDQIEITRDARWQTGIRKENHDSPTRAGRCACWKTCRPTSPANSRSPRACRNIPGSSRRPSTSRWTRPSKRRASTTAICTYTPKTPSAPIPPSTT